MEVLTTAIVIGTVWKLTRHNRKPDLPAINNNNAQLKSIIANPHITGGGGRAGK
jgi:hypothetical protein